MSENLNNLENTIQNTTTDPSNLSCPYHCPCLCECVKDIVELHNSKCIIDTYIYKNGYQFFCCCGFKGVIVGYGICVKYIDCQGCQRTKNQEGSVIFCNVPHCFGKNITVHICSKPKTKECPNAVMVEFPVIICD
ncbi:MAG: hypothetical protein A2Y17_03575 [Clostridiales bacterium GWF2_38_85]|nr:MAG: hypothetical protein A2Y17_03575 [Clostridiales bacterium GWF2_38_85]HBL85288.1 hypothetical protein [Clostridiales bacterium]